MGLVIKPVWLVSSWQSSSHWPSSYAAVAVPSTPSGRCSHENGFLQKLSLNWWFRVRANLRRLLKTENYHFLYTPCLVSSLNSKKCSFNTMLSSQEKVFLHYTLRLTSIFRCHSSMYFTFSLLKNLSRQDTDKIPNFLYKKSLSLIATQLAVTNHNPPKTWTCIFIMH